MPGQRGPRPRGLRGGGETLCTPVSSEFAGDETGNHDSEGGRQYSGHAQRDQRIRRDSVRQRGRGKGMYTSSNQ